MSLTKVSEAQSFSRLTMDRERRGKLHLRLAPSTEGKECDVFIEVNQTTVCLVKAVKDRI